MALLLGITLVTTVAFAGSASAAQRIPTVAHNPLGTAQATKSDNTYDFVGYRIASGYEAGSTLVFDEETMLRANYAYRTGDGKVHQNLNFFEEAHFCQYGDDRHRPVPTFTPEKAACKAEVTSNIVKMRNALTKALHQYDGVCFTPANRKLLITRVQHQVRITHAAAGFGIFFGATRLNGGTNSQGALVGGAVALATLLTSYLDVEAQTAINAGAVVAYNQAYDGVMALAAALGRAGTATLSACQAAGRALQRTGVLPGRHEVELPAV